MKQQILCSPINPRQGLVGRQHFVNTILLFLLILFLINPSTVFARLTQADSPFTVDEKSLLSFYVDGCSNGQMSGGPTKASYNATTGLFTWLPDYGDAGNYTLTFSCNSTTSTQVSIAVQSIVPMNKTATTPDIVLVGSSTWADAESENDQKSLTAMLDVYGLAVRTVADISLALVSGKKPDILVIPWHLASTLNATDITRVTTYVTQGGNLLITGKSALAENLGITYDSTSIQVNSFTEYLNPEHAFIWSSGETLNVFASKTGDTIYSVDKTTEAPVVLGRKVGLGRLLYVGTRYYDRYSIYGTKGHPYLLYHFIDYFKIKSMIATAPPLDAYFDPGNYDLSVVYVEDLIKGWAEQGITTVYVAAWHFWVNTDTGAEWTFDYKHFIETCHKRGILVYTWFAFPHVSQKFWVQHPECREQTALNGETYEFWRLGVNMQNAACLQLTLTFFNEVMNGYDWDGINIAELYYDYQNKIETFTPMNQDVRKNYQTLTGIDPADFFNPASANYYLVNTTAWQKFLDYRTGLVTTLHDVFLSAAAPHAAKGLELIVTAVDSLHYDYYRNELPGSASLIDAFETGVNLPAIVGMMLNKDFTLQVEDPWLLWNLNPLRYSDFNKTYLTMFPEIFSAHPERLFFDVNIDSNAHLGNQEHFVSTKQAGIEVPIIFKSMYSSNNRLACFSEKSIELPDLTRLKWALAADATISKLNETSYSITTPRTSSFIPSALYNNVLINGKTWPGWSSVDHRILIPAGTNSIDLETTTSYTGIKIINSTAELITAAAVTGGITLSYDSPRRKAVLTIEDFNTSQSDSFTVFLDDIAYPTTIASYYGHYYFFLPSGSHSVRILSSETSATTATNSDVGGTSCFIATAAYGSYLHDDVVVLRKFRDQYLMTNRIGQVLVDFYYRVSPPAAAFIQNKEPFRWAVRCLLIPIVYTIQQPGKTVIILLLIFSTGFFCFRRRFTRTAR